MADGKIKTIKSIFPTTRGMEHKAFKMFAEGTEVILISVEGNIGAGKSTGLGKFKLKFSDYIRIGTTKGREKCAKIIYVDEPLTQWMAKPTPSEFYNFPQVPLEKSMLEYLYTDPKTFAFAFQVNAFTTRVSALSDAIKKELANGQTDNCYVIIMERSILSDRWFMKLHTESGNIHPMFTVVYDFFYDYVAKPTEELIKGVLFINTNADICYERQKKRAREGEEPITLEYLKKVEDAHKDMRQYCYDQGKHLMIELGDGSQADRLLMQLVSDVLEYGWKNEDESVIHIYSFKE
jgi:deoxyadenosine/deoxycytidine kinase